MLGPHTDPHLDRIFFLQWVGDGVFPDTVRVLVNECTSGAKTTYYTQVGIVLFFFP